MLPTIGTPTKRLALAVLALVAGAGSAPAIDFSPEARRRVATFQQGLGQLPGSPGLSQILGGPAYGENGLLPSASEWKAGIQAQVDARQPVSSGRNAVTPADLTPGTVSSLSIRRS